MTTSSERAQTTVLPEGAECFEAQFHKYTFERHIHDTFAVGVTLSGVQRFWCSGTTYDSCAGDLMIIAPGLPHDGESGTDGSYSYRMAYLPEALIRSILADATERSSCLELSVPTPVVHGRALAAELDEAWSNARSAQTGDDLIDAFYEPIVQIATRFGRVRVPSIANGTSTDLKPALEYLHAHIDREIRASELARVAGVSRFRLTREFARRLGLPLHAYHIHIRLEAAKTLLRCGVPIAAAATRMGFCDQSHLHRRFKGAFGITPAQYVAAVGRQPK